MTSKFGHPRKILAVMDESDNQIALRSAAALAERHEAALEAFACVEPPHDLESIARRSGHNAEQLVAELVERTRQGLEDRLAALLPDKPVSTHVAVGKEFMEIIRQVSQTDCDFVVKAAQSLSGLHRFLFTSTDQHLLRKCPCPVWLQTETARVVPKCVVAAIDLDISDADEPETLSALNKYVLDAAFGIANATEAEIFVLHAWEAVGERLIWAFADGGNATEARELYINDVLSARQQAMHRFLASLKNAPTPGPQVYPRLVRGAPEEVIEMQSRLLGADVVVMGTVARTGLSGVFIGNTAENMINSLECPVLAVKPDGFVSPLLQD